MSGQLRNNDNDAAKIYNGSVAGTKIEVTDNPQSLIHSITVLNATAAEAYLQVYDADADNVTVGTTAPTFVIGCDATSQLHCQFPKPLRLGTGFTIASTTARAGASGATMEVTIGYNDSSNA